MALGAAVLPDQTLAQRQIGADEDLGQRLGGLRGQQQAQTEAQPQRRAGPAHEGRHHVRPRLAVKTREILWPLLEQVG